MDGGKNVRPGHRELAAATKQRTGDRGLAIRPLRRFVDFSSIIERTAAAADCRQQPYQCARCGGGGGGDNGSSSVRAAAAHAIGALNLDPIEIRITSQYCTGL